MGYQDKISRVTARAKRKLFDYRVSLSGTASQVLRIRTEEDMYRNKTYSVINKEVVPFVLKLPESLPLNRLRKFDENLNPVNAMDEDDADTTSAFFYDVLPIEGYSRFKDDIEKGDFIIKKVYADDDNRTPQLLVLQVTETLGNLDNDELTWKRHNLAPVTGDLPDAAVEAIQAYQDDEFTD